MPRSIPRVLSVAPLKLVLSFDPRPKSSMYSTRPKRGPIEAVMSVGIAVPDDLVFHAS